MADKTKINWADDTPDSYLDFLDAKACVARSSGFTPPVEDIHPALKPHQRDIVRWALAGGHREHSTDGAPDTDVPVWGVVMSTAKC